MCVTREEKKWSELGHFQLLGECSLKGLISLGQVTKSHFLQHYSEILIPSRSAVSDSNRRKIQPQTPAGFLVLEMLYLVILRQYFDFGHNVVGKCVPPLLCVIFLRWRLACPAPRFLHQDGMFASNKWHILHIWAQMEITGIVKGFRSRCT